MFRKLEPIKGQWAAKDVSGKTFVEYHVPIPEK